MIFFALFCNVSKSQFIDASCIILFYHHECHDTYIYFVSKGDFFSNYMNKKLSVFEFYGYYK
jgi:hypothetical protein